MTDHSHDHDHDHHQDAVLAGNIDIAADQTAVTAFSATLSDLPIYTIAQMVDDIDNFSTWTTDSVTFSFPTEQSDDYIGTGRDGTLAGFSVAQTAAAREVIALYGDIIDLEFVDSGTDVDADIRHYNSTIVGTAGGAPAGEGTAGDMWIYNYDPGTIDNYNLDPGSYQYHLLLHEMGHIMGLSHTTVSAGTGYEETATYLQNNAAYSQMSYLTASSAGLAWDTSYSSTPMMVDIAALQSIYGANMTTRTGDTVYGFNSTADRNAYDFDGLLAAQGNIAAMTIWDAGGTDTLDMSKFGEDGFIDLGEGTHSSVGGFDLNVAIAAGVTVERATAGAGDDIVLGNAARNVLIGNIGEDVLKGGAGNDHLYGDAKAGVGHDFGTDFDHGMVEMTGGQYVSTTFDGTAVTAMTVEMLIGFDDGTAGGQWFSNMPGDWTMVYDAGNQGLWFRSEGSWSFTGIRIGDFADQELHRLSVSYDGENGVAKIFFDGSLRSTVSNDSIVALDMGTAEEMWVDHDGGIADIRVFDGVRSAEDIRQNAWNELDADTDRLLVNVTFDAAGATDVAGGNDVFLSDGVVFSDVTQVGMDDVLEGGAGNDKLFGGVGADTLDGGAGKDTAHYRTSAEGVSVDLEAGTGQGGEAAGDTLISIEMVTGSLHDDRISGTAVGELLRGAGGADLLFGQGGKDRLVGDGGADVLFGGADNDQLIGGNGADTFVFEANDGRDRIVDFELDVDTIVFGSGIAFADLYIAEHALGSIVKVDGTAVIVTDVAAADLDAGQFGFSDDLSAFDAWNVVA